MATQYQRSKAIDVDERRHSQNRAAKTPNFTPEFEGFDPNGAVDLLRHTESPRVKSQTRVLRQATVLRMQQTIGNAAVRRMLAQRTAAAKEEANEAERRSLARRTNDTRDSAAQPIQRWHGNQTANSSQGDPHAGGALMVAAGAAERGAVDAGWAEIHITQVKRDMRALANDSNGDENNQPLFPEMPGAVTAEATLARKELDDVDRSLAEVKTAYSALPKPEEQQRPRKVVSTKAGGI